MTKLHAVSLVALISCFACSALAEDKDEYEATVTSSVDAPRAEIEAERKDEIGFQAGGSAYAQLVLRLHLVGPLYLDLGALGLALSGGAGNASAGFSIELTRSRLAPFLAAGGGAAGAYGEDSEEDPETGEEQVFASGTGRAYGYARVGFLYDLTDDRIVRLMLDAGAWYGFVDSHGSRKRTFSTPMFGLGIYCRF